MSYPAATLSDVFNLVIDAPAAGSARLSLTGHLDEAAARQVLHVAADVVQGGCSRLVVDLDGLLSWDAETTYALVGCARLARWLPEGVAVVAASTPGRELADQAGIAPDPDIMASCPAS